MDTVSVKGPGSDPASTREIRSGNKQLRWSVSKGTYILFPSGYSRGIVHPRWGVIPSNRNGLEVCAGDRLLDFRFRGWLSRKKDRISDDNNWRASSPRLWYI